MCVCIVSRCIFNDQGDVCVCVGGARAARKGMRHKQVNVERCVCQRTTVKRGIKTHISRFVKVQEIVVRHSYREWASQSRR